MPRSSPSKSRSSSGCKASESCKKPDQSRKTSKASEKGDPTISVAKRYTSNQSNTSKTKACHSSDKKKGQCIDYTIRNRANALVKGKLNCESSGDNTNPVGKMTFSPQEDMECETTSHSKPNNILSDQSKSPKGKACDSPSKSPKGPPKSPLHKKRRSPRQNGLQGRTLNIESNENESVHDSQDNILFEISFQDQHRVGFEKCQSYALFSDMGRDIIEFMSSNLRSQKNIALLQSELWLDQNAQLTRVHSENLSQSSKVCSTSPDRVSVSNEVIGLDSIENPVGVSTATRNVTEPSSPVGASQSDWHRCYDQFLASQGGASEPSPDNGTTCKNRLDKTPPQLKSRATNSKSTNVPLEESLLKISKTSNGRVNAAKKSSSIRKKNIQYIKGIAGLSKRDENRTFNPVVLLDQLPNFQVSSCSDMGFDNPASESDSNFEESISENQCNSSPEVIFSSISEVVKRNCTDKRKIGKNNVPLADDAVKSICNKAINLNSTMEFSSEHGVWINAVDGEVSIAHVKGKQHSISRSAVCKKNAKECGSSTKMPATTPDCITNESACTNIISDSGYNAVASASRHRVLLSPAVDSNGTKDSRSLSLGNLQNVEPSTRTSDSSVTSDVIAGFSTLLSGQSMVMSESQDPGSGAPDRMRELSHRGNDADCALTDTNKNVLFQFGNIAAYETVLDDQSETGLSWTDDFLPSDQQLLMTPVIDGVDSPLFPSDVYIGRSKSQSPGSVSSSCGQEIVLRPFSVSVKKPDSSTLGKNGSILNCSTQTAGSAEFLSNSMSTKDTTQNTVSSLKIVQIMTDDNRHENTIPRNMPLYDSSNGVFRHGNELLTSLSDVDFDCHGNDSVEKDLPSLFSPLAKGYAKELDSIEEAVSIKERPIIDASVMNSHVGTVSKNVASDRLPQNAGKVLAPIMPTIITKSPEKGTSNDVPRVAQVSPDQETTDVQTCDSTDETTKGIQVFTFEDTQKMIHKMQNILNSSLSQENEGSLDLAAVVSSSMDVSLTDAKDTLLNQENLDVDEAERSERQPTDRSLIVEPIQDCLEENSEVTGDNRNVSIKLPVKNKKVTPNINSTDASKMLLDLDKISDKVNPKVTETPSPTKDNGDASLLGELEYRYNGDNSISKATPTDSSQSCDSDVNPRVNKRRYSSRSCKSQPCKSSSKCSVQTEKSDALASLPVSLIRQTKGVSSSKQKAKDQKLRCSSESPVSGNSSSVPSPSDPPEVLETDSLKLKCKRKAVKGATTNSSSVIKKSLSIDKPSSSKHVSPIDLKSSNSQKCVTSSKSNSPNSLKSVETEIKSPKTMLNRKCVTASKNDLPNSLKSVETVLKRKCVTPSKNDLPKSVKSVEIQVESPKTMLKSRRLLKRNFPSPLSSEDFSVFKSPNLEKSPIKTISPSSNSSPKGSIRSPEKFVTSVKDTLSNERSKVSNLKSPLIDELSGSVEVNCEPDYTLHEDTSDKLHSRKPDDKKTQKHQTRITRRQKIVSSSPSTAEIHNDDSLEIAVASEKPKGIFNANIEVSVSPPKKKLKNVHISPPKNKKFKPSVALKDKSPDAGQRINVVSGDTCISVASSRQIEPTLEIFCNDVNIGSSIADPYSSDILDFEPEDHQSGDSQGTSNKVFNHVLAAVEKVHSDDVSKVKLAQHNFVMPFEPVSNVNSSPGSNLINKLVKSTNDVNKGQSTRKPFKKTEHNFSSPHAVTPAKRPHQSRHVSNVLMADTTAQHYSNPTHYEEDTETEDESEHSFKRAKSANSSNFPDVVFTVPVNLGSSNNVPSPENTEDISSHTRKTTAHAATSKGAPVPTIEENQLDHHRKTHNRSPIEVLCDPKVFKPLPGYPNQDEVVQNSDNPNTIIERVIEACKSGTFNVAFKELYANIGTLSAAHQADIIKSMLSVGVRYHHTDVLWNLYYLLISSKLFIAFHCSSFILKCKTKPRETFNVVKKVFETCVERNVAVTGEALEALYDFFCFDRKSWLLPVSLMRYSLCVSHKKIDLKLLEEALLSVCKLGGYRSETRELLPLLGSLLQLLDYPSFRKLPKELIEQLVELLESTEYNFIEFASKVKDKLRDVYKHEMPMRQNAAPPATAKDSFPTNVELIKKRLADDVAMFRHCVESENFSELSSFYKHLCSVPSERYNRFVPFVDTLARESHSLAELSMREFFILGSIGTSLVMEAYNSRDLTTALGIIQFLDTHDLSYFECYTLVWKEGYFRHGDSVSLPISPHQVALTVVDIYLQCGSCLTAFRYFKDYMFSIKNIGDGQAFVENCQWRIELLLKISIGLYKKALICEGLECLHILLKDLEKDTEDRIKRAIQNFNENFNSCFNLYLVKLLNERQLKEADELYKFRTRNKFLEVSCSILRAFVILASEDNFEEEKVKEYFTYCLLCGIYKIQVPAVKSVPYALQLLTCFSKVEMHLIIDCFLDRLFEIPPDKSNLLNWYSLEIHLLESSVERNPHLDVLYSISSHLPEAHKRTVSVLKELKLDPVEPSNLLNKIVISGDVVYRKFLHWEKMKRPTEKSPTSSKSPIGSQLFVKQRSPFQWQPSTSYSAFTNGTDVNPNRNAENPSPVKLRSSPQESLKPNQARTSGEKRPQEQAKEKARSPVKRRSIERSFTPMVETSTYASDLLSDVSDDEMEDDVHCAPDVPRHKPIDQTPLVQKTRKVSCKHRLKKLKALSENKTGVIKKKKAVRKRREMNMGIFRCDDNISISIGSNNASRVVTADRTNLDVESDTNCDNSEPVLNSNLLTEDELDVSSRIVKSSVKDIVRNFSHSERPSRVESQEIAEETVDLPVRISPNKKSPISVTAAIQSDSKWDRSFTVTTPNCKVACVSLGTPVAKTYQRKIDRGSWGTAATESENQDSVVGTTDKSNVFSRLNGIVRDQPRQQTVLSSDQTGKVLPFLRMMINCKCKSMPEDKKNSFADTLTHKFLREIPITQQGPVSNRTFMKLLNEFAGRNIESL